MLFWVQNYLHFKRMQERQKLFGHATFGQEERRVLCEQKMQPTKIEVTYSQ
jgi:hypothetical protein